MIHFNRLRIGEQAKVLSYGAMTKTYRKRLLTMGMTPGTCFTLLRAAPLGCPVEIELRGACLSVRRSEIAELCCERL